MVEKSNDVEGKVADEGEKKLPDGSVSFDKDSDEESSAIIGGGIFSDEARPSMGDLGGVEEKPEEKKTEEPEAEEKKAEEKKEDAKAEEKPEDKAEEKPKEKEEEKKATIPPGLVPKGALLEERAARRKLGTEILSLKKEVAELKKAGARSGKKPTEEADEGVDPVTAFSKKVANLSKEQEESNDPLTVQSQMLKLLAELPSVLSSATAKPKKEEVEDEPETEDKELIEHIVETGMELMEELVPGIRDVEGSDVNKTLAKFAQDYGMPRGFLRPITHPGTTIVVPGEEPRFLGDDAAYFVQFLSKVHEVASGKAVPQPIKDLIRAQYKEELLKEVRDQVTAETLSKVTDKGKGEHKSIGELPGNADKATESIFSDRRLSEVEYAKLSPEDKRRYLME